MKKRLIDLLTKNLWSHKEIGQAFGWTPQKVTATVELLVELGEVVRVGRNFYKRKVEHGTLGKCTVHIESYTIGDVDVRHGYYIEFSESGTVKKLRRFSHGKEVSL